MADTGLLCCEHPSSALQIHINVSENFPAKKLVRNALDIVTCHHHASSTAQNLTSSPAHWHTYTPHQRAHTRTLSPSMSTPENLRRA